MRVKGAPQRLMLFMMIVGVASCGKTSVDSSAQSASEFSVSIVIVKPTFLKANTSQSAQLSASEKCQLSEGTRIELRQSPSLVHSINGPHFKIFLQPDDNASPHCKLTEGFLFTEHVLQDIKARPIQPEPKDGGVTPVTVGTKSTDSSTNVNFIWPVSGGVVTSGFGPRFNTFHSGIDISTASGTDVLASATGHISFSGWSQIGYGHLVQVAHHGQFETVYGHNSSLLGLAQGKVVVQGDVIAKSGSSGLSTGPHVHFEIRLKGNAQDPLRYLPLRRTNP